MITVHHLEDSRSQRVLWLLEELDVPYEVTRYERDKRTRLAPAELLAIHPLGKSPVITHGDLVLAETGAIVEYLVETYGQGRLAPSTPAERIAWRYWLHYAEGSAMPPFLMKLILSIIPQRAPKLIRPIARKISQQAIAGFPQPQIENHMKFWEDRLSQSEWFAGPEFSAADIMMSFPAEVSAARANVEGFPKIRQFLDRIHARPAYQRALERGGPYGIIG